MSEHLPSGSAVARWSFLAEVSRRLSGSDSYEETLKTVAALALPRLGDWSIVDLADDGGAMRRVAVIHPDPGSVGAARRLERGWPPGRDDPLGIPVVMRTRATETVTVTDEFLRGVARDDEHLALLRELGITSIITVPLLARGEVLGAVTFVSGRPGYAHSDEDRSLAEELAARCAMAIHQGRLVRQLQQSVVLRDQVLGYVSHDLKNPLGAIMLVASHLLSEAQEPGRAAGPEGQIRAAETILRATTHMQRLIGDLLEVAQIEAGGFTLDLRPVDTEVLVEEVRQMYERVLDAHSLRLETVVPEGLPLLLADAGRLRQVFENLLENAAKFTPAGGTVTVSASLLDDSIAFAVADTGSGFHEDELIHLFDRFWQARGMGTGSAGLGLAICKGIVEATAAPSGPRARWTTAAPSTSASPSPDGAPPGADRRTRGDRRRAGPPTRSPARSL